jgi:hypothetical protein
MFLGPGSAFSWRVLDVVGGWAGRDLRGRLENQGGVIPFLAFVIFPGDVAQAGDDEVEFFEESESWRSGVTSWASTKPWSIGCIGI